MRANRPHLQARPAAHAATPSTPSTGPDPERRQLLRQSSTLALLGSLGASGMLAACGGSSTDGGSHAKLVSLALDAGALTLNVDGKTLASGIAFEGASGYADVTGGTRSNEIVDATNGSTLVSGSNLYYKDKYHTLLAAGADGVLAGKFLSDYDSKPDSGYTRLRFINLVARGGTVDVYVTAPGADLASAAATISGIAYEAASSYVDKASGTQRLRVTPNGSKTVLYDSGTLSLAGGAVVSVLLYTRGSGTLLSAYALFDSTWSGNSGVWPTTLARLRYVHGAALDGGAKLVVRDNGEQRFAALPPTAVTSYVNVGAGDHRLLLAREDGTELSSLDVSLEPARDYSLVVSGGAQPSASLVAERTIGPRSSYAKLRVLNAASDQASADLFVNYVRDFAAVAAGKGKSSIEYAPSTYTFTVKFDADASAVELGRIELEAGKNYTLALFGGAGARSAVLIDG